MLVSLGCSGSSAIMDFAWELLTLHGVVVSNMSYHDDGEIERKGKNPYFDEETGMGVAMKKANDFARSENATLIFKEQGAQFEIFDQAAPVLLSMGTYVVHVYRVNQLDRYVCMIKDCFLNEKWGRTVDKYGKESDLCWHRRKVPTSIGNYFAELHIADLKEHMKEYAEDPQKEAQRLKDHGFADFPTFTAEELTSFEYDFTLLGKSVNSWMRLLAAWGVEPNAAVIHSYLNDFAGKKVQESQKDTIYNYADVVAELSSVPQFAAYLHA